MFLLLDMLTVSHMSLFQITGRDTSKKGCGVFFCYVTYKENVNTGRVMNVSPGSSLKAKCYPVSPLYPTVN